MHPCIQKFNPLNPMYVVTVKCIASSATCSDVSILMISGIKKSSRVKQKPRLVESVTTDKEHVNVVFIGHVGEFYNSFEIGIF